MLPDLKNIYYVILFLIKYILCEIFYDQNAVVLIFKHQSSNQKIEKYINKHYQDI